MHPYCRNKKHPCCRNNMHPCNYLFMTFYMCNPRGQVALIITSQEQVVSVGRGARYVGVTQSGRLRFQLEHLNKQICRGRGWQSILVVDNKHLSPTNHVSGHLREEKLPAASLLVSSCSRLALCLFRGQYLQKAIEYAEEAKIKNWTHRRVWVRSAVAPLMLQTMYHGYQDISWEKDSVKSVWPFSTRSLDNRQC